MGQLFGRKISVECGNRGQEAYVFGSDFHIDFEYRRNDSTKVADSATVTIWNAGRRLGNLFTFLDETSYIRISGGYAEREGVLFMGDVTQVDPIKDGVNSGWQVICGDGVGALKVPVIKSYKPQMNTGKIIDDILDTMKSAGAELAAGMKAVLAAITTGKIEEGMTAFRGSAGDALEKVLGKAGAEPRIVNDEIYIVDKETGELRDFSVNLTPATGLIGSPRRSTRTEGDNKVTEGVTFNCLILPDIFPGRRVNIESQLIEGSFIVREMTARGSNYSGDWTAEVFAS